MHSRLQAVAPAERDVASAAVCRNLAALPELASVALAVYAAMPQEIAVDEFLDDAWRHGRELSLPRWNAEEYAYELACVTSREQLQPGRIGILEPRPELPVLSDERRAALTWLVPGVAFDRRGTRLGHGRGYYDRLLAGTVGKRIGIAYDWQLTEALPGDEHDVAMHTIVTDRQIWTCV
jgi:5-formyltetrahydrofolate cyclo-ligase